MEADSSQKNANDASDSEDYYSFSEAEHSLSDIQLKSSSDLQHSSFTGSLLSSSYGTDTSYDTTFNSSMEVQLDSKVDSKAFNSTLESTLAYPLSSSEASIVKSEHASELSLNSSVNCKRDRLGDKATASTTTNAGTFKAAKFDILKAMKADFCKIREEAKVPETAEARSNGEAVIREEAHVNEVIKTMMGVEKSEGKESKDHETLAKVKEVLETNESEEEDGSLCEKIIAEGEKVTASKVIENNEVDTDVNEAKDIETVAKVDEEPVAHGSDEMKAKVTNARVSEAPDRETVEDEVSSTTAIEVNEAKEAVVNTAKIALVNQAEVSEMRTDSSVGASYIKEEDGIETGGDNICEAMETEEIYEEEGDDELLEETLDEPLEKLEEFLEPLEETEYERSTVVEGQADTNAEVCTSEPVAAGTRGLLEMGTNEPMKAGTSTLEAATSSRFLMEEEDEFGPNEDSRGSDSILGEEAKRLDKLGLPPQVTPKPEVKVGEQEREKQYKKLVDLLSKSKFYTDVLLEKVEADVAKFPRKRKHPDGDKNGDTKEDLDSPSKQPLSKRKKILMENQRAMCQVASEVIKQESARRNKSNDANPAEIPSPVEVKPVEKIEQPKLLCGGTLRDYQLEGFNWLKVLYENGVNGILADEMGLGKTIQVIALLSHLVEMKVKGPFLIVGPLSTLPNWMIEFKRFAPQLHVTLFHGSKVEREKMYQNLTKRRSVNGVLCFPIVVTSYEIPVFEKGLMASIKWKYIIVDEGHRIKNYNTVLAKVLRSFDSANRLLLTGTPLHNCLSELWSLLNFLVPEIFDNLEVFESWFRIEELSDDAGRKKIIEEERRKNVLSTLHQILAPFMLRRIKSEVTIDVPKKKEVLVQAPMTDIQLKLYQAVLEKNIGVLRKLPEEVDLIIPDIDGKRPRRSCTLGKNYEEKNDADLEGGVAQSNDNLSNMTVYDVNAVITHHIKLKIQSPWQALKQIASHPYLIHYPMQEDGVSLKVDEAVVKSSGKFLVLDAMLEKLHARGHKVLLFSTLCILLDVVEDYLSLRHYTYERLDGSVKITDRADSIQRFNSDPNIFLFLLSTRAGGLGVNLTGADTVIFMDSDWNPQADLQAQDRCHRIGQTKPVMVYRLITSGTIDEEIQKKAAAKRVLEKIVICKGTSYQKDFDLEELKTILESKDHSEIVYTDGQVLTDEQLDKLLDRSDLLD